MLRVSQALKVKGELQDKPVCKATLVTVVVEGLLVPRELLVKRDCKEIKVRQGVLV